ncbi:MAG: hypothetical protein Q8K13_10485 [Parvibaculum sp.]|uniref:hypothetical protein n=1 Tax=Parvibaculum sp. TaxID=2024848 RepID=UPI002731602D|nr:hypothetical protein [Parvibaculum sp.]MDP2150055.1 hypothetical protein [Parvibaculum sp.]
MSAAGKLTQAQAAALKWFREHGGDGVFDKNGVLLAAGESAPHMRSTWNSLARAGLLEFYGGNTGRRRARLTARGAA